MGKKLTECKEVVAGVDTHARLFDIKWEFPTVNGGEYVNIIHRKQHLLTRVSILY